MAELSGEELLRRLQADQQGSQANAAAYWKEQEALKRQNHNVIRHKIILIGQMTAWMAGQIRTEPDVYMTSDHQPERLRLAGLPQSFRLGERWGWALVHTEPHTKMIDDGQSPMSPKWQVRDAGGGVALMRDGDTIVHYQETRQAAEPVYVSSLSSGTLNVPPMRPSFTATEHYYVPEHCKETFPNPAVGIDDEYRGMHSLAGYYEKLVLGFATRTGLLPPES